MFKIFYFLWHWISSWLFFIQQAHDIVSSPETLYALLVPLPNSLHLNSLALLSAVFRVWCKTKSNRCREVRTLVCIAGENVNGAATMENSSGIPRNVKHRVIPWSSNSTPGYRPKRIENGRSSKHMDASVQSGMIYNSQKVETTRRSINWRMGKQTLVYLDYRLFFSHKKEWRTDTC